MQRELARVIVGAEDVIRALCIALIARGHVLVQGPPGLGKTLLAKTLARVLGGEFKRVQGTADLMPSDIVGTHVFDSSKNEFVFRRGPLFADVLLVDEINRTGPKTQSALLEAMEERQVSSERDHYSLPEDFLVLATQNPREFEGTYPLPESQLDRFMLRIDMNYPERAAEGEILQRYGTELEARDAIPADLGAIDRTLLHQARAAASALHVSEALSNYVLDLARATREHPRVSLGLSTRGALALLRAARVHAGLRGGDFVAPDDVQAVARWVHRAPPGAQARGGARRRNRSRRRRRDPRSHAGTSLGRSSHALRAARLPVHRADRLAGHRGHLVGRPGIRGRVVVSRVPAARRARGRSLVPARHATRAAHARRFAPQARAPGANAAFAFDHNRGRELELQYARVLPAALRQSREVREVVLPPGRANARRGRALPLRLGAGRFDDGAGQVVRAVLARLVVARRCRRTRLSPWRPDSLPRGMRAIAGESAGETPRRLPGFGVELLQLREYAQRRRAVAHRLEGHRAARRADLARIQRGAASRDPASSSTPAARAACAPASSTGSACTPTSPRGSPSTRCRWRIASACWCTRIACCSACLPDRGMRAVTRLRHALETLETQRGEPDPVAAAIQVRRMLRHRGLVVWLTDLAEPARNDALMQALKALVPRHLPIVAAPHAAEIERLAEAPAQRVARSVDRDRRARASRARAGAGGGTAAPGRRGAR